MKHLILASRLALVSLGLGFGVSSVAIAVEHMAPEVSLDEFKKVVAAKSATIIDANGAASYKSGHIPGAIHFAKHESDFASVLPKDKNAPIIAYCGGPLCTAWEDPAVKAKALGYTNIRHFKGGISGRKSAGQPVDKGV